MRQRIDFSMINQRTALAFGFTKDSSAVTFVTNFNTFNFYKLDSEIYLILQNVYNNDRQTDRHIAHVCSCNRASSSSRQQPLKDIT